MKAGEVVMGDWARFWPIDLHVHTPGSSDAKPEAFGSPEEIVAAAIGAGLAAIAVTDHNTAEWCDRIAAAAEGTSLIVLPGVEISTTEGHLLAVWEEGTSSTVINEMLVSVGIKQAERGKLDIAARVGLAQAAQEVVACGGVAIAAHADKPKGLLNLSVKSHLQNTLMDEALSAVEVVHMDTVQEIAKKVGDKRILACVRASDTWDVATSAHALSGIGARRTWLKASRPDLVGLQHGLADPDLRIALVEPNMSPSFGRIEQVDITGGFLNGQRILLCPDLNCLLGGTGVGKSLILEAIRYAMDQQLDRSKFPKLWDEVQSRLESALTESGVVRLHIHANGHRYRVERAFSKDGHARPSVYQQLDDDWVIVDLRPAELLSLAAFSQGEILEYSREPVGRMTLVDSGIDISEQEAEIATATQELSKNARTLIACRKQIAQLRDDASKERELKEQVRLLATLFDTKLVKQQGGWQKERSRLGRAIKGVSELQLVEFKLPKAISPADIETNDDLFKAVDAVLVALTVSLHASNAAIETALVDAKEKLAKLDEQWSSRFSEVKKELDAELERVNPGSSLKALRERLEALQEKLTEVETAKDELRKEALPALKKALEEREGLITRLSEARHQRRELRRGRVEHLNSKTAGFVKLDIPNNGDYSDFRAALDKLKIGSRVRDSALDAIARTVHPLRFARALWDSKVDELVNDKNGIDAASIGRLLGNIDERDLWEELLKIQMLDRPDVVTVRFRKPDDQTYVSIEQLAHGQRCTAILVILLADGNTPVLIDQPEDALHAPWIEEYLVDRLRSLRGSRQYIFATRSPGIVVSGDAEQIVTMKATAGQGDIEASGSLERHDLNRLTLHHLEGGPIPFKRRTLKLRAST
jgi:hypothetical protein